MNTKLQMQNINFCRVLSTVLFAFLIIYSYYILYVYTLDYYILFVLLQLWFAISLYFKDLYVFCVYLQIVFHAKTDKSDKIQQQLSQIKLLQLQLKKHLNSLHQLQVGQLISSVTPQKLQDIQFILQLIEKTNQLHVSAEKTDVPLQLKQQYLQYLEHLISYSKEQRRFLSRSDQVNNQLQKSLFLSTFDENEPVFFQNESKNNLSAKPTVQIPIKSLKSEADFFAQEVNLLQSSENQSAKAENINESKNALKTGKLERVLTEMNVQEPEILKEPEIENMNPQEVIKILTGQLKKNNEILERITKGELEQQLMYAAEILAKYNQIFWKTE
ncbi:Hypothetical_protein [Hexamita inflata]|uniref:Hypothetical_protein n=1 Tax=Hexamita inflata TaxID=28002 RepID=A0AA86TX27_9EUKA|nr:Hypothetical protein HINF_LOCUS11973 [Hexamita inflata]